MTVADIRFRAQAVILAARHGLDTGQADDLATWLEQNHPHRHGALDGTGIILGPDAQILAHTARSRGEAGAWYVEDAARLGLSKGVLDMALAALRREHGQVAHVAANTALTGVPSRPRAEEMMGSGRADGIPALMRRFQDAQTVITDAQQTMAAGSADRADAVQGLVAAGLSRYQVAAMTGLSEQRIGQIEKGA